MRKVVVFILFLLFFYVPVFSADSENDSWEKVAPNNYVDADGITGTQDFYGYSFILKSYNKGQYEPVNNRQVFYTLGQYEINCSKHTYRIGIIDSYDKDDYFINGDYNKYAQFQPIVEGTAIEVMATKLCKL